ncbi:DUF1223 domain-containing protein [Spirosoma pollinicola]|uniref:DUF1223 domain-containing protein n=1 Tax=Spirosoma pollinicola TaxID=2057025 RepID=A0A2K8Z0W3_9BACT|nr:DUF1223 domain-containing protein [Spirosoma pollinicola]AUD03485.1 DUF1223 domain-containing protein [Spirosoma pollinicola]
MHSFTPLIVAASLALTLLNLSTARLTGGLPHPKLTKPITTYAPVAVLELFTSQGCSSCPAADRLLTETLAEAAKANKNIIGLSFHVDYWDRLGWKDPFSNHSFTQRQYQYSERFAQTGVYTPQEVLNGQQEFVGSNRNKQSSTLKEALSIPATADIKLTVSTPQNNQLTISYLLAGDLTKAVLHVAVVSKTTETIVNRGENAGRKLAHDNVVRVFLTVPATEKGVVTLALPIDYDARNGAVVAYVQTQQTLAIRGAEKVNL